MQPISLYLGQVEDGSHQTVAAGCPLVVAVACVIPLVRAAHDVDETLHHVHLGVRREKVEFTSRG
jgi:hypothetical protein